MTVFPNQSILFILCIDVKFLFFSVFRVFRGESFVAILVRIRVIRGYVLVAALLPWVIRGCVSVAALLLWESHGPAVGRGVAGPGVPGEL